MTIRFFLDRFQQFSDREAIVWRDQTVTYQDLLRHIARARDQLKLEMLPKKAVVALDADYSPVAIGMLFALFEHDCTVALLRKNVEAQRKERLESAEVEWVVAFDEAQTAQFTKTSFSAQHQLHQTLRQRSNPGLIIFTSGSTGRAKAALHDATALFEKFETPRRAPRMLLFLLFDHIGGFNTLLHILSNGGCAIIPADHSIDAVCQAVETYQAEVLPVSPSFLNLLLISQAVERYNLSSLQTISFGTEPMPETVLEQLHAVFPKTRFVQLYGLTELGILRSKSRPDNSLWVQIGGENTKTRIVDGLLEIKASSSMLGYLNAASPVTADGWFKTGDAVEVDGEWMRILGRQSDMINVGGKKVFPTQVENVLQMIPNVIEVAVKGEPSPVLGQIVSATFRLSSDESVREFRKRMRQFCATRLPAYQIPAKVKLVDSPLHSDRFKKVRR